MEDCFAGLTNDAKVLYALMDETEIPEYVALRITCAEPASCHSKPSCPSSIKKNP